MEREGDANEDEDRGKVERVENQKSRERAEGELPDFHPEDKDLVHL